MDQKIMSCARQLHAALKDTGSLNLWEARAILGESRDFTRTVLHVLAFDGDIRYRPMDGQLCIALAEPAGETRGGHRH
jgi:hypothetical protein